MTIVDGELGGGHQEQRHAEGPIPLEQAIRFSAPLQGNERGTII
jgi:hypothetical protein